MSGLLLCERLGSLLPGGTQRGRVVVGEDRLPVVEDVLRPSAGPRIPVGTSGRGGTGSRSVRMFRSSKVPIAGQPSLSAKAIGTSSSDFIFWQSDFKFVECGWAPRSPCPARRLPVEDRPWIVGLRHEVLLAVVAGGGLVMPSEKFPSSPPRRRQGSTDEAPGREEFIR